MNAKLELTLDSSAISRIIDEIARWRLIDEETPSCEGLLGMCAAWPHPFMIFRQSAGSLWQMGWSGGDVFRIEYQPTHFIRVPDFFKSPDLPVN